MPKKKTLGSAISTKAIVLGLSAALVLVVGGTTLLNSRDKNGPGVDSEAMTTLQQWIDDMTDIKNEPSGCCLPLCEEYGETECNQRGGTSWSSSKCTEIEECSLGCCQIDCLVKENFPKSSCVEPGVWTAGACEIGCCHSAAGSKEIPQKTCLDCTANSSWEKGKCGPGFYVSMDSTFSTTVANTLLTQYVKLDMYTCSDSVFSLWKGTEMINTNGKVQNIPITMDFTEGYFGHSIPDAAGFTAEASVTENKMTMDMAMGLANFQHHFEGDVRQGATECQKRL